MIDLTLPLERLPDPLPMEPLSGPFDAAIAVPGSKSLTCRAYVLAALADGDSSLTGALDADDTDRLLEALRTLGAQARRVGEQLVITGGEGRLPRGGEVNLGDGGAPTRFTIAAACLAEEPVVVDGSARMRQRPVAEGVELLRRLGAGIEYVEDEGRLPVRVTPASLTGGEIEVPTTLSSQFVSAVMLIAPFLPEGVSLAFTGEMTSAAYVALTARVLGDWGVTVKAKPPIVRVASGRPGGRVYAVEPDASSAAAWMIAAAAQPGSTVTLPGVTWPSPQPDANVVGHLRQLGAEIEPVDGALRVRGPRRPLDRLDLDARNMPDAALGLAALAATGRRPSTIRGLRTLRVKETDRIAALAAELRKTGCTVEATDDSLTVDPAARHDRPAVIETYGDHRMAMAFAVLGLARPGLSIADPACVSKSYPGFWRDLARLYD